MLAEDQARLIPSDAMVRVLFEQSTWPAVISRTSVNPDGNTVLTLTDPAGGPVCAAECARLPGDEQLSLSSEAVLVPEQSGPAVPAGAVRTDPTGATYVLLEDGSRVEVTVLASGQGVVLVEGLDVDQTVLVSGEPTVEEQGGSEPADGGS